MVVRLRWGNMISGFLGEDLCKFGELFGDIKFHGGEGVFSDKLPVNARDVWTTVNQGVSVNNFQCVGRSNEL